MPRFCLNMIVKNEAGRIVRALDSCGPYITSGAIVDTGSTDDTMNIIRDWFAAHKLPLNLTEAPFVDWSQARNVALDRGRAFALPYAEYLLLMDADMELIVKDAPKFLGGLRGISFDMYQHAGACHYLNRRIVRVISQGGYKGVTHEYLNIEAHGKIPESTAFFLDHADGANRPEKYKRDIRLLKDGLKAEPNNERYYFYLAQSYRDAQMPDKALQWFKKRVAAGGWDEEVWQAQLNAAHCYLAMNNEAEFIRNLLIAYNMRPSRVESLYDLAHYYRERGMNDAAVLVAKMGMTIPHSTDALFVNDYAYEVGVQEEYAITAFYTRERAHGFEVCDHLSLKPGPYAGSRELARFNMYWYLEPLSHVCPSFKTETIQFKPEDGWAAMNPSVANIDGALDVIVRTVNYRMDEEGRYLIRATDGTANDSNPITTRNFLVRMYPDFTPIAADELLPPGNMPVEFAPVIGFEDMRLFNNANGVWASSTVRQLCKDGNCEQVRTRIGADRQLGDMTRMLRAPRGTEKNWMPIIEPTKAKQRFMYRLGEVVDDEGNTVIKHENGYACDHVSGGSQVIPFDGGWLALVHEARPLPDKWHKRYYYHRFAFFDQTFRLEKLSRPFVFEDKVIEFAAGMCHHPDGQRLVISYGFKDAEARIATVASHEVKALLWYRSK